MFCSKCGQSNPDEAKFCKGCGGALAGAAAQSRPTPPPQQQQYAAPGQKKKGIPMFLKVILGIFIFIVLIVAIALFATSGVVKPVEEHLALLQKGDVAAAYNSASQAFKNVLSLEEYKKFVSQFPFLSNNKSHNFSEREIKNNIGRVKGTITSVDGAVVPIIFSLVKENGQWKIISIDINPKDF